MRLARHGSPGSERPIVAGSDQIWRELSSVTDDISSPFLRDGLSGLAESVASLPVVDCGFALLDAERMVVLRGS